MDHFSLSFIASGRSSGLHPVSSHSRCMYVRAGRLAFARPYAGVHRSTSLRRSSLLLQQCPACLVRLTWIVCLTLIDRTLIRNSTKGEREIGSNGNEGVFQSTQTSKTGIYASDVVLCHS